jgi:hypothetical protein
VPPQRRGSASRTPGQPTEGEAPPEPWRVASLEGYTSVVAAPRYRREPGGGLLAAPSPGLSSKGGRASFRPVGRRRCKQRPKQWVKPSSSAVAATTERSPPATPRATARAGASPYRPATLPYRPCLAMKSRVRLMIFLRLQIQREVPGVQDVYLGARVIPLVRLSASYGERSIVTPPKNKQRRLVVTKPLLPFREN